MYARCWYRKFSVLGDCSRRYQSHVQQVSSIWSFEGISLLLIEGVGEGRGFIFIDTNFSLFCHRKIAIKLSGLEWATIAPCYRWMEPYFHVILQQPKLYLQERNEQIEIKLGVNSVCANIVTDDSHIIQMHTTSMDMFVSILYFVECIRSEFDCCFEKLETKAIFPFLLHFFFQLWHEQDQASLYREQCLQEASPAPMRTNIDHVCPPEGLLTPPDSSRKFLDTHPDSTYKWTVCEHT